MAIKPKQDTETPRLVRKSILANGGAPLRAAKMKEHPDFPLMWQVCGNIYHIRIPRWLFTDPRYADMSLDAKVAYTFLPNRFQLSRRNGWTNEQGEDFALFPRDEEEL